jgi:hypothetical protein
VCTPQPRLRFPRIWGVLAAAPTLAYPTSSRHPFRAGLWTARGPQEGVWMKPCASLDRS